MATGKRKRTVENFKGVYDGVVMPEFKNIDVELNVSFEKLVWSHTGIVDMFKPYFKLDLNVKNSAFRNLLNKDMAGVLGWKAIPFNREHNMFFIEKKWGTIEEQKELLVNLIDKLKEVDNKIDLVSEESPVDFMETAQKYNNSVETEHFFIEYDTENKKAYVVFKSKESTDFMTFKRANIEPYSELMGKDRKISQLDHKVKDIPGYKNKSYLKNYVRSVCFCVPDINYSMVNEVVELQVKLFNQRKDKVDLWLNNPENKKRVENVLIKDFNPYGLIVEYEPRKKVISLSCPLLNVTVFNDKVTSQRKKTIDMLFFNKVLARPKKDGDEDYSASSSDTTLSLNHDKNDLWHEDGVEKHKLVFHKRADSKGKILYLEIEKNIDELEVLKKNYEEFKSFENKFTRIEIPNFISCGDFLDDIYPTIYLDENNFKAYLLYDGNLELKSDGLTHSFVANKGVEIEPDVALKMLDDGRVASDLSIDEMNKYIVGVYENSLNLKHYKDRVNGSFPTMEMSNIYMKRFEISWHMSQVMSKYGKVSDVREEDDNPDVSSSSFGFKI